MKTGYITISFKNNGMYNSNAINRPILDKTDTMYNERVIGVITDVNDEFVTGIIYANAVLEINNDCVCSVELNKNEIKEIKFKNNSDITIHSSDSETVRGHRSKCPYLLFDTDSLIDREEINEILKPFMKDNEENFKREYECVWTSSADKEDK